MLDKNIFKKEDLLYALEKLNCSGNCACCCYFNEDTKECEERIPCSIDFLESFIKEYFEPRPYTFNDLKCLDCDYVYDKKEDDIIFIIKVCEKLNKKTVYALVAGYKDFIEIPFKENRFYPINAMNVRKYL